MNHKNRHWLLLRRTHTAAVLFCIFVHSFRVVFGDTEGRTTYYDTAVCMLPDTPAPHDQDVLMFLDLVFHEGWLVVLFYRALRTAEQVGCGRATAVQPWLKRPSSVFHEYQ